MVWPKQFTSKEILKKDINSMNEVTVSVLKKTFGKKLQAIYFNGSANKNWKSPIDYVPEVSDIDIHVLVKDQSDYEKAFSTVEKVMDFSNKIEKEFFRRCKKPSHIPLLQVLCLNEMHKEKEYVPSLKEHVKVLCGKDYPPYDKAKHGRDFASRGKVQILENEGVLKKTLKRGLHKYSSNLEKYFHEFSWRISSSGPNFLCMKGHSYEDAWFLTRTDLVKELKKLGYKKLAKHYEAFYMNCWNYFLKKDSKYARLAIINGYHTLEMMIDEAKKSKA